MKGCGASITMNADPRITAEHSDATFIHDNLGFPIQCKDVTQTRSVLQECFCVFSRMSQLMGVSMLSKAPRNE